MRIPEQIPIPVDGPSSLSLYRHKRDFGITATVVVAVAAAAAATAAIAMTQTVATATALNNLSTATAQALSTQSTINSHLRGGIMILNQRIDLVQDQVNVLWRLAQLGCEWHTTALCLTGIPYDNMSHAANLSRDLSRHLTGNWSLTFDNLTEALRLEIISVNATRVDPDMACTLSSWIAQAAAHLKEWAGMGTLTLLSSCVPYASPAYAKCSASKLVTEH